MRAPKKPLSAWIVTNREAQPTDDGKGWTSGDLARRLGVSDSTVRGWEAGRSVSEGNLELMERLFGVTAPGHDEAGDQALVAAAINRQTEAVDRQTEAIDRQTKAITEQMMMLERMLSGPTLSPEDLTWIREAKEAATSS